MAALELVQDLPAVGEVVFRFPKEKRCPFQRVVSTARGK
jgi:hypothetical protein